MSAAAKSENYATTCFEVAFEGHVAHVKFNRPHAMIDYRNWREFPEIIR